MKAAPLLTAAPLLALWASASPAAARVLEVGPGHDYASPSAAAAAALDGDTVTIAAGEYFDCAIWHADRLTIIGPGTGLGTGLGTGPGAVLSDLACQGKAAFVVQGDGVTLRGLTFTRIRVPDGNGAGVRAEGRDLTVVDSRFVNDQDGILASGGGFLRIVGCAFVANGTPGQDTPGRDSSGGPPTHSVLAGGLDLLRIENSVFQDARGGDHIASAARRTELEGNRLADAGGHIAGPLVAIAGGAVTLAGNTIDLTGAGSPDRPGAVLVVGDATALIVRGNTLVEPTGDTPLVRNWTGLDADATDNRVPPGVAAVSDAGAAYHRLRAGMAALRARAGAAAGMARHGGAALARRLGLLAS